ncbi:hypothetical protein THF1C08_270067 [Vibrio jasicida]|uniref:Uncharacterized protein n=1 Tax=Vibrio jasicida TaxID=766224 RepID=A0AAU9QN19_9VIBR|nr:hypothetical protein THF1C08_270067 [Vibrio jasicida]CAH1593254.1 hypothetical protein THF1A12_260067 [Vibrio jasicida]
MVLRIKYSILLTGIEEWMELLSCNESSFSDKQTQIWFPSSNLIMC